MKVLILAGGLGSRLGEETSIRPKPMVEIGNKPILWHIMKIYSYYGFNDFIILTGYKHEIIKQYFLNYYYNNRDITIDFTNNKIRIENENEEKWKVTILNTGEKTLTAGRVYQARKYIGNEDFMLTYGDGVGNINIPELINEHKKSKKLLTLTAFEPSGRFGRLEINNNNDIINFAEKPDHQGNWINIGFMVCNPQVFNYFPENSNEVMLESGPLSILSKDNELHAYKHNGFWHPMDMLKDKLVLNDMWNKGRAPWKIW